MQTVKQKACKNCGVSFTPKDSLQNCHSIDCFYEYKRKKEAEKNEQRQAKQGIKDEVKFVILDKLPIKNCRICGEKFTSRFNRVTLCENVECRKTDRKEAARRDYEKHRERCRENAKRLRYTLNCGTCKKEFKAYTKTLVYCSKTCQSVSLKENRL